MSNHYESANFDPPTELEQMRQRAVAAEALVRDAQEMIKAAAVPHYVCRIAELTSELERAQAGAAALREAASVALEHLEQQGACMEGGPAPVDSYGAATVAALDAALATDAGDALLERLRLAESYRDGWRNAANHALEQLTKMAASKHAERSGRLLRAAQSLHRAWGRERDLVVEVANQGLEQAAAATKAEAERDALRQCAEDRAAQLYCSLNSIISEFRTTTGQWAGRAALVPADPDFARILSRTLKAAQSLHRRWSNQRDKARAEVGQWARCVKELRAERDALRAEVASLRATIMVTATDEVQRRWRALEAQRDEAVAAQLSADSDRKALLAERDALAQRLSSEHLCGHGAQSCDACTDSWSIRERALVKERDALARGIAAMVADGLDIDDPGTAPVWTGKVLERADGSGVVLFDLARQIDWHDTMVDAGARLEDLKAAWAVERVGVAQEMAHVREQLQAAEAKFAAMREALNAADAKVEALRAEANRLVSALMMSGDSAAAVSHRASVERERDALHSDLSHAKDNIVLLTDEVERLRAALKPLSKECATAYAMAHDGVDNPQTCDEAGTTLCLACRLRAAIATTKGGG